MIKLKVYSYVVRKDNGLAPNPFWDYCTLALDQSLIRQITKVGDWIVGLKETSPKIEDHKLLFAMKITEKLTFAEYWNDERFHLKKPDFIANEHIFKLGDNIYTPTNGDIEQRFSMHSKDFIKNNDEWEKQKKDDLQGKYVLISDKENFFYFGNKPEKIPNVHLIDILYCDIGHKCIADPEVPKEFLEFLDNLKKKKKYGLVNHPTIWPNDDESYVQCQ